MTVRQILVFITVGLLALGISACSRQDPFEQIFWDGDIPVEERPTIEEYQRTTEPAIINFITAIAQHADNTAQYKGDRYMHSLDCEGWRIEGPRFKFRYVDPNIVDELSKTYLKPAGLITPVYGTTDNQSSYMVWYATESSGDVSADFIKDQNILFVRYSSGCRPTDGSTTQPDQFIPGRNIITELENRGITLNNPQPTQSGQSGQQ